MIVIISAVGKELVYTVPPGFCFFLQDWSQRSTLRTFEVAQWEEGKGEKKNDWVKAESCVVTQYASREDAEADRSGTEHRYSDFNLSVATETVFRAFLDDSSSF